MIYALRRLAGLVAAVVLMGTAATLAVAQQTSQEIFQARRADFAANVLAVSGFDTVAYHTQRSAVPGNANFRVSWKDAEWHFASQANRDLFAQDPDRYAPQYGGRCAFALAQSILQAPIRAVGHRQWAAVPQSKHGDAGKVASRPGRHDQPRRPKLAAPYRLALSAPGSGEWSAAGGWLSRDAIARGCFGAARLNQPPWRTEMRSPETGEPPGRQVIFSVPAAV